MAFIHSFTNENNNNANGKLAREGVLGLTFSRKKNHNLYCFVTFVRPSKISDFYVARGLTRCSSHKIDLSTLS